MHGVRNEDEAAELINNTTQWSNEKWYLQQQRSIDRAYQYLAAVPLFP